MEVPRASRDAASSPIHVVLLGAMGAGKTAVGRALAARLDRNLFDSDAMLEAVTGLPGRDIAAKQGIGTLHRLERLVLREALAYAEDSVIAAAASVVDDERVIAALEHHRCVWLWAESRVLAARHPTGAHRRDIGSAEVQRVADREAVYRRLAGFEVDTGSSSVEQTVREIAEWLVEAGPVAPA